MPEDGKITTGPRVVEHLPDAFQHRQPQRAEYRAAVVDGGLVDGAQDAVGHVGGPRNLQEMPAGRMVVQGKHATSPSGIVLYTNERCRRTNYPRATVELAACVTLSHCFYVINLGYTPIQARRNPGL
ncbi:hypothetical protein ADE_39070 [Achromobacter denitrificans]|nr:hypothetical protein ADE_39070 [Achromobacter denitrificans]